MTTVTANPVALAALAQAKTRLGDQYVFGAAGPSTFDCSGLCYWAYRAAGHRWVRTDSAHMIQIGTPVQQSNLLPGDLIRPFVGHIFMYAGNGIVIESPKPGMVVRTVKMYGFLDATRILPPVTHTDPVPIRATMQLGSTGSQVRALQTRLNTYYPLYSRLVVDGDFGPATRSVVLQFQKRSRLVQDGIVGPATLRALGL